MPDGRIEARQVTRLQEIGQWLKNNGDAVYNTFGGPYEPTDHYASTRKGNKIYLHVLNTDTATIELKKIPGRKIQSAAVLGGKQVRSEEHTSELQSLMRTSYAAFCLKKK